MTYKRIFVSENAECGVVDNISKLAEEVVFLKSNPVLPRPVSAHADMQMLYIVDTLILTRDLYNSICEHLPSGINIMFAESNHTSVYPGDVNLNAMYIGGYLIANESALDPAVKKLCEEKGITILNVKQGYAKCSSLQVGDNALITADSGIAKAAMQNGIDTLLISSGSIVLDGYDYGFIGGASFYNPNDRTVYFFGDLHTHPDYTKIIDFCEKHNVNVNSCNYGALTDIGGAVSI